MSDDLIHLTLSRADADIVWTALCCAEGECAIDTDDSQRLLALLDAALNAAPAEGPERAATGETLPGLDIIAHPAIPEGTIIAVTDALIERVAKAMTATDFAAPWDDLSVLLQQRYREQVSVMLAAIGGGGEG